MISATTTKKLRIFLADDHPIVREGLKAILNSQPDMAVVGEAADGRSAVESVPQLGIDIVVMDICMPQLNGIRATQELRGILPNIKIIALTVHEDRSYLRQLMEAGAVGFVLKQTARDELVGAVRAVAEGRTYIDPIMSAKVLNRFAQGNLEKELGRTKLSEREEDVLRLIASGLSNKEIAAHLAISVKTVETYKSRSLQKLGLRSRSDIVRYSVAQGWLQEV